jgi:hypothetical protein
MSRGNIEPEWLRGERSLWRALFGVCLKMHCKCREATLAGHPVSLSCWLAEKKSHEKCCMRHLAAKLLEAAAQKWISASSQKKQILNGRSIITISVNVCD